MQARRLVGRVLAQPLAALDVGVDRAALDRPRSDDRDLDGELGEVLRTRAPQRLHLRAALDLEDPGRLGALDRGEGLGVVEGNPREVDPLVACAGDELDGALDRREHSQPEQVDLQEARVGARILVPVDELAALHRRGHHRAAVDQRAGRDDHPAGVLGDVPREPVGLVRERHEPVPAAARLLPPAAPAHSRRRARRGARSRRRPWRRVRSPPAAAPGPCPARGSPRVRESSGRSRRARRGHGRSARGRGGSAPRARRAGSRGRCPAARSARGSGSVPSRGRRRAGRCARGRSGSRPGRRPTSRARAPAAAAPAPSPRRAPPPRPRARARESRGAAGRSRRA